MATTNIFGLHTQPRKTTRYTNILKVAFDEKRAEICHALKLGMVSKKKHFAHLAKITIFNINNLKGGKSEKEPAIAVNFVEDFQIEKKTTYTRCTSIILN